MKLTVADDTSTALPIVLNKVKSGANNIFEFTPEASINIGVKFYKIEIGSKSLKGF